MTREIFIAAAGILGGFLSAHIILFLYDIFTADNEDEEPPKWL